MTVATVTKTIGSGQTYTTLQTWHDGAPANLTTAEKWNAGTFVGTFQQGETVTGTGLTAGKFLDSDGSSYVTFGIVTGNSATLVTLTGSTSGATCIVSSKTDTGIIWKGSIAASTDVFSTGTTAALAVAGSTTSSSCWKELTAGAGASFIDHASVQTNTLRYDSTLGCAITHSKYNVAPIEVTSDDFKSSRIQVKSTNASRRPAFLFTGGSEVIDLNQMIWEGGGWSGGFGMMQLRSSNGKIRNSLWVDTVSADAQILNLQSGAKAYNCTFVVPTGLTKATKFNAAYSTAPTIQNCAIFGMSDVSTGAGDGTFTTCYIDDADATGATGCTRVAYDTSTGSGFQNIANGTHDYRIKSGSAMLDVGTTDSTNAATDIAGTARPQGSAYDVGCWELVAAAGGRTTKNTRAAPLGLEIGMGWRL